MDNVDILTKNGRLNLPEVNTSLYLRRKFFRMSQRRRMHFEISERKIFLRIFDVFWVLLTLYLTGLFFQLDYFSINSDYWVWTLMLALYLMLFSSVFELYDLQKASKYETVLKNVLLATSVTVLVYLFTPILTPVLPNNRMQILYFYLAVTLALLAWRFTYIRFISSPRFYKRVLVIGDAFDVDRIADHFRRADPYYSVVSYLNTSTKKEVPGELSKNGIAHYYSETITNIIRKHKIDEILINELDPENDSADLSEEIFVLLKRGYPVRDFNQVYEEKTHRIPVQMISRNFYEFFRFSKSNENKVYQVFHRAADIIISVIGLFIGLLLVPFIFLGNLIGNRGKLFYRQERIGQHGEVFEILKFRTMEWNAEPNGAQWTIKNDSRVTGFGKFLRRSRLDEIPQFYNILKGDMSFIGPRPERPFFVKELSESIPFYDTRHFIKPGLTGWAQVMTEYADSHADSLEKLQYDLYYIKHRNIFLDITILTKTLSTIIFFRGQ